MKCSRIENWSFLCQESLSHLDTIQNGERESIIPAQVIRSSRLAAPAPSWDFVRISKILSINTNTHISDCRSFNVKAAYTVERKIQLINVAREEYHSTEKQYRIGSEWTCHIQSCTKNPWHLNLNLVDLLLADNTGFDRNLIIDWNLGTAAYLIEDRFWEVQQPSLSAVLGGSWSRNPSFQVQREASRLFE